MKKIIILYMLILTTLVVASSPVAVVLKVKGTMRVKRAETESLIYAQKGTLIYNGDVLNTEEKSLAAIKFVDNGAVMKMRENSLLTVSSEKKAGKLAKKVSLEIGNIWSKVVSGKGTYRVETGSAVASVKGTKFYVSFYDGLMIVGVEEGTVGLKNHYGEIDIHDSEAGKVEKNKPPQFTSFSQIDHWSIDEDEEKLLEIEMKSTQDEKGKLRIKFKK